MLSALIEINQRPRLLMYCYCISLDPSAMVPRLD